MRTIKLTLAYDGTAYAGWQLQLNAQSVQGQLEARLAKITGENIRVAASGRTDSGVHALGQVVTFQTESLLPIEVLQQALNAELPHDIAVLAAADVPAEFHARRSALRKRYRYVIHDARAPNVFERNYVWHSRWRLDEQSMQRAAQALVGTHDFASFETSGSPRASTVRTVYEVAVERTGARPCDHVIIEVEADGFLYNMVRTIVGTLAQVGRGVESEAWPGEVLSKCDRRAAGQTAPAQGLYLLHVEYPEL